MQPQQDQNYWQPDPDSPRVSPVQPPVTDPVDQPAVPTATMPSDSEQPVSWQASEFVHHEKSIVWFLGLLGAALLVLLVDILLIHSRTFGVLIVVMAIAAIVVARRPPRVLTYAVSRSGVSIEGKLFPFRDFRAFGVVQEGAFFSIRLIPSKRFMPMVSVYFPPEHGEQIVDMFGSVLPMEQIKLDPIDKFVEKIRF